MSKNELMLCDYKEEIARTYGYDDELAQNIAMMAESVCEIYGPEYKSTIFDAVKACKFVPTNNSKGKIGAIRSALKAEGVLDQAQGEPDYDHFKHTSAVFKSKPIIESTDGEYRLSGVDRVIVMGPRFDWDNPDSLGNLAREVDRLTNSYLNGYEIEGNMLRIRQGLSVREDSLSTGPDGVVRTFVSETGRGLESGVSEYNAQKIVRTSYSDSYDITGSDCERLSAGVLMDSFGLENDIRWARIIKEYDQLRAVLDAHVVGGSDALLSALDRIDDLEQKRLKALDNGEMLADISKKIDREFSYGVAPLVRGMDESMNEVLESGYYKGV